MSMDDDTARLLASLTGAFYRTCAASFSATRQRPWHGFEQLAATLSLDRSERLDLFDLACGNLRFERFAASLRNGLPLRVWACDNAPELVQGGWDAVQGELRFQQLDIVGALVHGAAPLSSLLDAPPCDLSVCFGFLHHVPRLACRAQVLEALLDKTRVGGLVAVSFWRFMDDTRLAAKAREATGRAQERFGPLSLEKGDYLLGWKERDDVYRYCHHFGDDELAELEAGMQGRARLVADFSADGKSGALNRYLVWQRR